MKNCKMVVVSEIIVKLYELTEDEDTCYHRVSQLSTNDRETFKELLMKTNEKEQKKSFFAHRFFSGAAREQKLDAKETEIATELRRVRDENQETVKAVKNEDEKVEALQRKFEEVREVMQETTTEMKERIQELQENTAAVQKATEKNAEALQEKMWPSIKKAHEELEVIKKEAHVQELEHQKKHEKVGKLCSDLQEKPVQRTEEASKCLVEFRAKLSKKITTKIYEGERAIYDLVDRNIGNGYQRDTGYFVAPYSGRYSFFVQTVAETSSIVEIARNMVVVKGKKVVRYDEFSYDMELKKNDRVAVWVRGNIATDRWDNFTMFSGRLLL